MINFYYLSLYDYRKVMADWKTETPKILSYLVLFCLSFLIFEFFTLIFAVGVALFALYYFTSKRSSSN